MTEDREPFYIIERYLNGEMSYDEKLRFEKRLAEDSHLYELVEEHKLVNSLIEDRGLLLLKEKMQAKPWPKPGGGNNFLWYGAIAFVVIGIAVFFGYQKNKQLKSETKPSEEITFSRVESPNNTPSDSILPENNPIAEEKKTIVIPFKKKKQIETPFIEKEIDHLDDPQPVILPDVQTDPKEQYVVKNMQNIAKKHNNVQTDNNIASDPCKNINIDVKFETTASCEGKKNGLITILPQTTTGGYSPYKFELYPNSEIGVIFQDLASGSYHVIITDSKSCRDTIKNINVKERLCPKEYGFAPIRNEQWEIPVNEEYDGKLTIYSMKGEIIFQQRVPKGEQTYWNGETLQGNSLTGGTYPFQITYSNGHVINGMVSILQ